VLLIVINNLKDDSNPLCKADSYGNYSSNYDRAVHRASEIHFGDQSKQVANHERFNTFI
jgi:hypothetical protein